MRREGNPHESSDRHLDRGRHAHHISGDRGRHRRAGNRRLHDALGGAGALTATQQSRRVRGCVLEQDLSGCCAERPPPRAGEPGRPPEERARARQRRPLARLRARPRGRVVRDVLSSPSCCASRHRQRPSHEIREDAAHLVGSHDGDEQPGEGHGGRRGRRKAYSAKMAV